MDSAQRIDAVVSVPTMPESVKANWAEDAVDVEVDPPETGRMDLGNSPVTFANGVTL